MMTFRHRLTKMVVIIIIVSIIITGTISSVIINSYFQNFLYESYEDSVGLLLLDAENLLLEETQDGHLQQYLREPISSIAIYNQSGALAYYESDTKKGRGRMKLPDFFDDETDQFEVISSGEFLGTLVVARSTNIQDSESMLQFSFALLRGLFFASAIALTLSYLLSRRMSQGITNELEATAIFADRIDVGKEAIKGISKTLEIKSIQTKLVDLSNKLKMQDRIRKTKVDRIAHETRTPITILKGQLEGSLDGVLEMDEQGVKTCLEAVNKLQILTQDIAMVLAVDEEEVLAEIEAFDLMDELRMIQTGLAIQFESKGLTLTVEGPEELFIESDKNLLSIALYNLIINALKFTRVGSVKVTVKSSPTTIWILDTGIGIEETHLAQVFDPYYRGVSQEDFEGDGLGLYITKKNIDALGGQIRVNSIVGKGTEFELILS